MMHAGFGAREHHPRVIRSSSVDSALGHLLTGGAAPQQRTGGEPPVPATLVDELQAFRASRHAFGIQTGDVSMAAPWPLSPAQERHDVQGYGPISAKRMMVLSEGKMPTVRTNAPPPGVHVAPEGVAHPRVVASPAGSFKAPPPTVHSAPMPTRSVHARARGGQGDESAKSSDRFRPWKTRVGTPGWPSRLGCNLRTPRW